MTISILEVKKIVSLCTKINLKKLSDNSKSEDFDYWDSVANVKIILELEKIKKKKINSSLAFKLNSIKKIHQFLNK